MDYINDNAQAIENANAFIAEEEKKINDAYTALGKVCYEINAAEPAEEYSELVGAVNAAKAAIEEKKAEILELKGLIICPLCKAEIDKESVSCPVCAYKLRDDITENGEPICAVCKSILPVGSVFCNCCGAKVGEVAPAAEACVEVKVCPVCAKEVSADSAFCNYCGAPLAEAAPVSEPEIEIEIVEEAEAETEAPVAEEIVSAPDRIYCPCCSMELSAGLMFCTNCGTKITNDNPAVVYEAEAEVVEEETGYEKDSSTCRNCGMSLAKGLLFCTNCGTKVEEKSFSENIGPVPGTETAAPEGNNLCPHCAAEIPEGIIFCINCGVKLAEIPDNDGDKTVAIEDAPKVCPNCGTVIADNARFCTGCGMSI